MSCEKEGRDRTLMTRMQRIGSDKKNERREENTETTD